MTALDARSSAAGNGWHDELEEEQRRRLRNALVVSAVAHGVLVALLWVAPAPEPMALPRAITVDLVAAVPQPAAPEKPAAAKPAPAPPKPAPPPPPPAPKKKVELLPKEAPTPTARPQPKPEPAPKPEPDPVIRRRERPEELSYADALARLRSEVGETAPEPAPAPEAEAEPREAARPATGARDGVLVAPEVAAWNLAVMRHVRANWITPPEFRESGLAAQLEIDVAADGRVRGEPELVRSSGNPFFDDNAVRAVRKASPLPAPPEAGRRTLIFTSEE